MGAVVQGVNQLWDNSVGWVGNQIGSLFTPPAQPSLQAPTAKSATPTLPDANTTALQNQLAKEKTAASTSAVLTSGQGLLDEPTTTSRVLMGS